MKGIGAEQIVSFLKQHCHPQMYHQNQLVPRTVADQVSFLHHINHNIYLDFEND